MLQVIYIWSYKEVYYKEYELINIVNDTIVGKDDIYAYIDTNDEIHFWYKKMKIMSW